MPAEHLHNRPRARRLVACSVCLRVHERRGWVEAVEAIRRLRTFEHKQVVRLDGTLCDRCALELRLLRRSDADELAA
jgi:hypothetical protein